MSRRDSLMSLEGLLESFLERAVAAKEKGLSVANNRSRLTGDYINRLGEQIAVAGEWPLGTSPGSLKSDRMSGILGSLQKEPDISPAALPPIPPTDTEEDKDKTGDVTRSAPRRIVLKGRSEEALPGRVDGDTVLLFGAVLSRMAALFSDFSGNKKHVLSVLDDTLNSATLQKNKETLLLSAIMIYYLKIEGYKVEPYVRRLKKAELQTKEGMGGA